MGLLRVGKPMGWHEALPIVPYVKEHGIQQFLNLYNKLKDRSGDVLKWGDEIEYMIIKRDDDAKTVKLSLRAKQILENLVLSELEYWREHSNNPDAVAPDASWKPEYGRFMIEGTPFFPFEGDISYYLKCEESMAKRREIAESLLEEDESLISMTMFPLIGAIKDLVHPPVDETTHNSSHSQYLPDEVINEHPRFPTLTANIRERRGGKVCILVPLFMDTNTDPEVGQRVPWDNIEQPLSTEDLDFKMSQRSPTQFFLYSDRINVFDNTAKVLSPDDTIPPASPCQQILPSTAPMIHMDAMGFGMGCCCLQTTFQARDIVEARNVYDQLAVICPIFLALSAATPIVRGLLAETDVRWNIVSASVDDRTPKEKAYIAKSRYDSISSYIGTGPQAVQYSDLELEIDQKVYDLLVDNQVDQVLARHVAHLFVRDPLVIFTDYDKVDDEMDTDHFENIQSTNWQTVRFKPPPANSTIGWRVEFRVLEVQMSDFENAAFAVFVILLSRVIIAFDLDFYMPLSRVDMNMALAHKRDAVNCEKFVFRTNIQDKSADAIYSQLTIGEIMNGKGDEFVGLIPLVVKYLDGLTDLDAQGRNQLNQYIELLSRRASGELMTAAAYLRKTVREHPEYKQDSVVTEEIAYDLVRLADRISSKQEIPVEMFGNLLKK
ncbi:glutamate-cysteine ligase catalytic subunit [Acrasis kona]|uniref:Glutamate--cysteine ligase n=1 Tax=Acrasis kona TaxID=1008807 RepID=A0AAW2YZA4_9EUKA